MARAKALKFILLFAITTFPFALNCGAPVGPVSSGWTSLAVFPGGYCPVRAITSAGDGVYALCDIRGTSPHHIIFKYDGSRFSVEYILPYKGTDAGLSDIKITGRYGGEGWAAGGRRIIEPYNEYFPILIYYDRTSWREIDASDWEDVGWLSGVFPAGKKECWLLDAGNHEGGLGGTLLKYDDGVITKYPNIGFVTAASAPASDLFYVLAAASNILYITADDGRTWFSEPLALPLLPGYEIEGSVCAAAAGDAVYFLSDMKGSGQAIYKRTGGANAGVYTLEYLSNWNPNFYRCGYLAISKDHRAMAVGADTSVYGDGERWVQEEFAYPTNFAALTPGADIGFFAAAYNEVLPNRTELLYHP